MAEKFEILTHLEEEIDNLHTVINLLWEVTARHPAAPYLIISARKQAVLIHELFLSHYKTLAK